MEACGRPSFAWILLHEKGLKLVNLLHSCHNKYWCREHRLSAQRSWVPDLPSKNCDLRIAVGLLVGFWALRSRAWLEIKPLMYSTGLLLNARSISRRLDRSLAAAIKPLTLSCNCMQERDYSQKLVGLYWADTHSVVTPRYDIHKCSHNADRV